MTLAGLLGKHSFPSADALSKEALSTSEIQQVQDRFQVNYIAPLNLEFAHSMRRLLHIELSTRYNERSAIANILEGKVHKAFETGFTFVETGDKRGLFRYSLEHPSIDHLFDNKKLCSCTLQSMGKSKEQAALLINDPYSAMIHVRKITKGNAEKVAISYSFLMEMRESSVPIFFFGGLIGVPVGQNRDVLLVDDVNGYLGTVDYKWGENFRHAHEQLARHTNSELIAYGVKHGDNTSTAAEMDKHIAKHVVDASLACRYFKKKEGAMPSLGNSPNVYISNLTKNGRLRGQGECTAYTYATPKK